MRPFIAIALLGTACSQEPAKSGTAVGTFVGEGRNRLCIAGEVGALRAGLIAYGDGNVNCSAAGSLQSAGQGWVLVPRGEGDCRIPLRIDGNKIEIGSLPAACSYYCGPGARMAGKNFNRAGSEAKAVDLAGDPLC